VLYSSSAHILMNSITQDYRVKAFVTVSVVYLFFITLLIGVCIMFIFSSLKNVAGSSQSHFTLFGVQFLHPGCSYSGVLIIHVFDTAAV